MTTFLLFFSVLYSQRVRSLSDQMVDVVCNYWETYENIHETPRVCFRGSATEPENLTMPLPWTRWSPHYIYLVLDWLYMRQDIGTDALVRLVNSHIQHFGCHWSKYDIKNKMHIRPNLWTDKAQYILYANIIILCNMWHDHNYFPSKWHY